MSKISAQTIEGPIPLGRRIGEIMEEKGDAFSIRAFGSRIGMTKDMLSRCINGERYLKPSELEKVAKGLGVSIERIKQVDNKREQEEIQFLLQNMRHLNRALELTQKMAGIAIGITERSRVLNDLGRVYYAMKEYDKAHFEWIKAYEYAKKIAEKYGETSDLYNVVTNISILLTVTHKYIDLIRLLSESEKIFELSSPIYAGKICYSYAAIAYKLCDIEEARNFLKKSLHFFEITGNIRSIGKAEHTLACVEYKVGRYHVAKELFERSTTKLCSFQDVKFISIKDYAKTLIKLGESAKAIDIIHKSLTELECIGDNEMHGIYLLLLSIASEDRTPAEKILQMENVPHYVLKLTCKHLAFQYRKIDDSKEFMKYSKMADGFNEVNSDILDEEEL